MKNFLVGNRGEGGTSAKRPWEVRTRAEVDSKRRKLGDSPLNIHNSHPHDAKIVFVEDGHSYFVEGERARLSVTGLKDIFLPPFNQEKILEMKFQNSAIVGEERVIVQNPKSRVVTKDVGLNRTMVLDSWDKAAETGTYYHEIFERFYMSFESEDEYDEMGEKQKRERLLELDPSLADPKHKGVLKQFLAADDELKSKGWSIFRVEWKIFDKESSIAGGIDAVFRRETANGEDEFLIADWKITGKKLKQQYGRAAWERFCQFPLGHLPNSKLSGYSLQLNIYAHILKNIYNVNVTSMCLVQIDPHDTIVHFEWLSFLTSEVESMFRLWRLYRERERELLEWKKSGYSPSPHHPASYYPPFIPRETLAMQEMRKTT